MPYAIHLRKSRADLEAEARGEGESLARHRARLLAFAAVWDLWTAPGGAVLRSLATVTTEPNADVAAVHHRMPAILEPADWPLWLGEADGDAGALLRPFPQGRLRVEQV